jgi:hypothetical protein
MRKKMDSVCAIGLLPVAVMGLIMAGNAAADEGQPTIAKDWVQITAYTFNVYHKNFDVWSWVPRAEYRVNGPIASGSQLYAEFDIPGAESIKFDCKTGEVKTGHYWKTDCGARDVPEDKGVTYTGVVNFSIRMRNELNGANLTLFTGKMKVLKVHSNEHGPKFVNHFVYYVDQDWNLPIGYVYFTTGAQADAKRKQFNAAFWYRGEGGGFEPHLMLDGKEVGKISMGNMEMGKASCSTMEVEDQTTHLVEDAMAQKAKWTRIVCNFPNVQGSDKDGKNPPIPGQVGSAHYLSENPGEYEIKVLWKGHLARSIKFTVRPDGKFDNGIAADNNLGSHRIIVPVQIIGEQDGKWDHNAWKTDAFYGNPLTGFTAVQ